MASLRSEIVTRSIRWMVDSGLKVTEWLDVVPYKVVICKKRYRRGERIFGVSELRVELNALTMAHWQEMYDVRASEARDESSVKWLYELCPSFCERMCGCFIPNYFTSQVLNGHGCFNANVELVSSLSGI